MFEFGFLGSQNGTNQNTEAPKPITWFPAREIHPKLDIVKELMDDDFISLFKCENYTILEYVNSDGLTQLFEKLKEYPVFRADKNHSDLLTGVYEGGQKIWECTYDLANYMSAEELDFKNKKVLDLGCGAGIIGILAFIGGSFVYFQDYNEEIIIYNTIPNVYLNTDSSDEDVTVIDKCKFYSGDWSSFLTITENDFKTEASKFDYIFTCETIYNPENYKKLHLVFKERLKENGVIYLAAKTHYFGVGGGLRQFEEFMKNENVFNFSTCWKCSDGLQREILKITFKHPTM